ncbi:MAG: hypothetical protein IPG44_13355 [Anaerolineales bacterium]|jgi:DNA-directed RNA polymerase subunit RPC12/RpoP|nr:hypothetical protein [Chloroflexota bacterium]MBK6646707.1 hypothetical protein [Anaerolineales bacterium]MCC6985201.1 hypothetical protein [Anaerolineales bacterium]
MPENTMNLKLIKCPSCGGPIDPPGGESAIRCPYCGSSVVIPESLRKPAAPSNQSPSSNLFGDVDANSLLGYSAQWSQVVQLAQQGRKEEAVQKYMSFSPVNETDAQRTVEGLALSQVYDVSAYTASIAPMVASYTDTAKKITAWSFGFSCLITGFIMLMVLLIVGGTLWAVFNSF